MEKEFVPYELALRMKTLGFDEPCFAYQIKYQKPIIQIKVKNSKLEKQALIYRNTYKGVSPIKITLPTFSQAFRWFREKYKLVNYIEYYAEWNFEIFRIDDKIAEVQDDINVDYTFKGGTYEEAELACLNKLLEITETK
jgi:hypothetical protein